MLIPLCSISDIEDPGSMGFELTLNNEKVALFVVHKDAEFHAFINRCPHTGANLEWQEHQFLDLDKMFIQCSNHDALFEIDSGRCIAGPCVDESLDALELVIENDSLKLKSA